MLDLCKELKIAVNDLLNVENVTMENRNLKNEQLLLDITKELEQNNLDFYISNHDYKYDSTVCRYISCSTFNTTVLQNKQLRI